MAYDFGFIRLSNAYIQGRIGSTDSYDLESAPIGVEDSVNGSTMQISGVSGGSTVSYTYNDTNDVDVTLDTAWNSVKNIQMFTQEAATINIDNFVHTEIDIGGNSSDNSNVTVSGVKRGFINTGGGDDIVDIDIYTNGGSGNFMNFNVGDGDDSLTINSAHSSYVFDIVGDSSAVGGSDIITILNNYAVATVDLGYGALDVFVGGGGRDIVTSFSDQANISGNGGDDELHGYNGDDTISGGSGADDIYGGQGVDMLDGGSGSDDYYFELNDKQDVIVDTSGSNDRIIFGTNIRIQNLRYTRDGDDLNISHGQRDGMTITDYFADGANTIENIVVEGQTYSLADMLAVSAGSSADDNIDGQVSIDVIDTSDGNDYINGRNGNDIIHGGDGDDEIHGWNNDDDIYGDAGRDQLFGGGGNDRVYGGDDDDEIVGGAGNDLVDGGQGLDTLNYLRSPITGSIAADLQAGLVTKSDGSIDTVSNIERWVFSESNDMIVGSIGDDIIEGRGGADNISSDAGNDIILGGDGNDILSSTSGTNTIKGDDGDDQITGGDGIDSLWGGAGNDTVLGGDGRDTFVGSTGNDSFDGEGGYNSVTYVQMNNGVDVAFDRAALTATVTKNGGETDSLANVHRVLGSNYDDTFSGGMNMIFDGQGGNDIITGSVGADYLRGGSGNDTINGARGRDRLFGGSGNDTFIFERGGFEDTIVYDDATSLNDTVEFAADVAHDQLWFEQVGNNLRVSIIGTNGFIQMENWYSSGQAIDSFESGDGMILSSADVQNLVNAMASESKPLSGELTLDTVTADNLSTTFSANWS